MRTIKADKLKGAGKKLKDKKALTKEGRRSSDSCVDAIGNGLVQLISNYIGNNDDKEARQWSTKEKKFINIFRPLTVEEYNKHMDGVDLGDMHVDGHIELRSTKNYTDIVFYCMNLAVVNGWLLYRRHCSQKDVPDKNQMRDQILIKYIECLALVLVGKQPKSKRG